MSQATTPEFVSLDLDESLAWTVSLAHDLNGSTITGVPTWTVPAGLTNVAASNTTTTVTIRLSATAPGVYAVEYLATLANSEKLAGHFTVTVTD